MIRRYLFQILFVVAAAPHVLELPKWVSAVAFFFLALAFLSNLGWPSRLPRRLVQGITLVLPLAVYLQFKTLLGPEASTSLFIMLVSLKLHELESIRDRIIFLIFITLVVMYWLLFSQTLMSTVYMLAMLFAIGFALISIHSPHRSIKEIWSSTPRTSILDVALVVPVFLAFFFLFPRFTTPFSRFMPASKNLTGFPGELRPGEMADLVQSNEIAFRAIFKPGERPPSRELYWRGQTLTVNEGLSWRKRKRFSAPAENLRDEISSYEIILEPRFNKSIFLLEPVGPAELKDKNLYNQIVEFQEGYLETRFPLIHRVMLVGQTRRETKPTDLELSANERRHHLQYDFAGADESLEWIRSFAEKEPKSVVREILKSFRRELTYSATTPKMKGLDDFLFNHRKGFCEHFASSFAILMRMAGVPSRVVIGFQGGEFNEFGDYLIVRDRHAHAWTEIWLEGEGWRRVDPTLAVNQQRFDLIDAATDATGQWANWGNWVQKGLFFIEALNSEYVLFLLNFNSKYQLELLNFDGRFQLKRWMLFVLLAIVLALMASVFYFSRKWTRRRDPIEKRYEQILKRLRKDGLHRAPSEGPYDFALRISESTVNDKLKKLLFDYVEVRYGPPNKAKLKDYLQGRIV